MVEAGIDELVMAEVRRLSCPTGPIVNVNPSEVIVAGAVT